MPKTKARRKKAKLMACGKCKDGGYATLATCPTCGRGLCPRCANDGCCPFGEKG